MDTGFLIAAVFLAIGIALTVWVIAYKDVVLSPLAEEQLVLMHEL